MVNTVVDELEGMEAMRRREKANVGFNGHPGGSAVEEVKGLFGRSVSDVGSVGMCAIHVEDPQLDTGDVREEGEGELQTYA